MVQCNQENSKANGKTSGYVSDKDRHFWLAVRRALFIFIQAIEERYDMPQTRAGR